MDGYEVGIFVTLSLGLVSYFSVILRETISYVCILIFLLIIWLAWARFCFFRLVSSIGIVNRIVRNKFLITQSLRPACQVQTFTSNCEKWQVVAVQCQDCQVTN